MKTAQLRLAKSQMKLNAAYSAQMVLRLPPCVARRSPWTGTSLKTTYGSAIPTVMVIAAKAKTKTKTAAKPQVILGQTELVVVVIQKLNIHAQTILTHGAVMSDSRAEIK